MGLAVLSTVVTVVWAPRGSLGCGTESSGLRARGQESWLSSLSLISSSSKGDPSGPWKPCCSGDQGRSGQSQKSASKNQEIWHHWVRACRGTTANAAVSAENPNGNNLPGKRPPQRVSNNCGGITRKGALLTWGQGHAVRWGRRGTWTTPGRSPPTPAIPAKEGSAHGQCLLGAELPWVGNTGGDRQPAGTYVAGDTWGGTTQSPTGRGHEAQSLRFSGRATSSSSKGCCQLHLDIRLVGSGSPGHPFP